MRLGTLAIQLFGLLAVAQEAQPRRLPAPNGAVAGEFHTLISVRELMDGTVLLADRGEQRLVIADLLAGTTRSVSRRGSGPGEYERLFPLLQLGGDTTLMPDAARARWLMLDGSRVLQTIESTGATQALRRTNGVLGAHKGVLLARAYPPPAPDVSYATGPKDSLALLTVSLSTGELDTIGALRRAPARTLVTPGQRHGELFRQTIPTAWAGDETAVMCNDGWIAVVRTDPYKVDWRSPNGRWILGRPLPYTRVRVTEREKQVYIKRVPTIPGRAVPFTFDWPREVPPQGHQSPVCSPDGRVFLLRSSTADREYPLYDVVDRTGILVHRLALSANQRIIGFGARSAYVVSRDTLDVQRLFRYPYPWP